jgi:hypothetical protein
VLLGSCVFGDGVGGGCPLKDRLAPLYTLISSPDITSIDAPLDSDRPMLADMGSAISSISKSAVRRLFAR